MVKIFPKEYGTVYVKCHETAISLNFNITEEDITKGVIMFKVGMSLLSWGEKFKVEIIKLNTNTTSVEVASESAFRAQLVDWGKNDENVKNFFQTLTKLLKA